LSFDVHFIPVSNLAILQAAAITPKAPPRAAYRNMLRIQPMQVCAGHHQKN